MPNARRVGGSDLMLASFMATLSYVPFKLVAQATLFVCAFMFIVDPFPPLSRIVAIICTAVVHMLSKLERIHVLNKMQHNFQANATDEGSDKQDDTATLSAASKGYDDKNSKKDK